MTASTMHPLRQLVAAVGAARAQLFEPDASGVRGRGEAFARKLVLIVEDDADLRGMLEDALVDAGYDVITARHGAEALRKVGIEDLAAQYVARVERLPNLILLDWRLPVMNGWDFYVTLKQNHRTKHLKVVVMTGYPEETEALPDWVLRLRKPLDIPMLLAIVAREAG